MVSIIKCIKTFRTKTCGSYLFGRVYIAFKSRLEWSDYGNCDDLITVIPHYLILPDHLSI